MVHVTMVLLMLLSFRGCVHLEDMETSNGGVMVSFGELDAGGGELTPEETTQTPEENLPSDPAPSDPVETPDPVVTNDDSDAPVVKKETVTKPKEQPKEEVKKKPTIDPNLRDRLKGLKNKSKGDGKEGESGEGRKPGKYGDPNAKNDGPGGTGGGPTGSGEGLVLAGFSHGNIPQPQNRSQNFQKIRISFCVDRSGNLLDYRADPSCPGCGMNQYLVDITVDALKKIRFRPTGGSIKDRNCGSFTVDYRAK